MSLYFRYNSTTYNTYSSTSKITTPSLCFRQSGTTYYTPLLTSRSQTIDGYTYDASSPTICVRYNGTTYYAAKSRTAAPYDIPAGTYTPSAFKTLIESYISDGGSRTCSKQFTATVNSQTITVASGTSIYYSNYTSNGTVRAVRFGSAVANVEAGNPFTTYMQYIVYAQGNPLINYASYPITIDTGIKFS